MSAGGEASAANAITARLSALLSAGHHSEAEARALAAVSAGFETPLALKVAGAAHRRAGRLGEALSLFARAVAAAPAESDGWIALAATQLAARQPEAAIRTCDEGLTRMPRSAGLLPEVVTHVLRYVLSPMCPGRTP